MIRPSPWSVVRTSGSAALFHEHVSDSPFSPTIWMHEVDRPTLVLGSTQPAADIDAQALGVAGWEVCRRRSGGGLVILQPGESIWIDVFLPTGHELWSDDVSIAGLWVGDAWATALRRLTSALDISVHRGRLRSAEDGRHYCFAGLGAGEVTVDNNKVVGLSQRRTRHGARFQSLFLARPILSDPGAVAQVLPHCSEPLRRLIEQTTRIGWPSAHSLPKLSLVAETFREVVDKS